MSGDKGTHTETKAQGQAVWIERGRRERERKRKRTEAPEIISIHFLSPWEINKTIKKKKKTQ